MGGHNESHITKVYEQTIKSPLAFLTDCASGFFIFYIYIMIKSNLDVIKILEMLAYYQEEDDFRWWYKRCIDDLKRLINWDECSK